MSLHPLAHARSYFEPLNRSIAMRDPQGYFINFLLAEDTSYNEMAENARDLLISRWSPGGLPGRKAGRRFSTGR